MAHPKTGKHELNFRFVSHPRYKYETTELVEHKLRFYEPGVVASLPGGWAQLNDGMLRILPGYMWNGPDFIRDVVDFIWPALFHDPGYQLIGGGHLPVKPWKRHFDREFRLVAEECGVGWVRRNGAFIGVRLGGRGRDVYRP